MRRVTEAVRPWFHVLTPRLQPNRGPKWSTTCADQESRNSPTSRARLRCSSMRTASTRSSACWRSTPSRRRRSTSTWPHDAWCRHRSGLKSTQQPRNWGNVRSQESVLLVDVGSGPGQEMARFRQRHPEIAGRIVLQDLPLTLNRIDRVPEGIALMEYDFFTPQPVQGM